MQKFPAPAASAELAAASPAMAKAFSLQYPDLEVLRVEPRSPMWAVERNENTGIVTDRQARYHLAFRHEGRCYYVQPVFVEDYAADAWGEPRFVFFAPVPNPPNGKTTLHMVGNISAAPLPCEEVATASARR